MTLIDYRKVASIEMSRLETLYHLQNVYEEEIQSLVTVTFEEKLDFLISSKR